VHYERDPGFPRVDDTTAIHVYRVLQEALTNVAKHAGVQEAWVRLRSHGQELDLQVEDHGTGLEGLRAGQGLGLVAMRERATLVGGTLALAPRPGGGTLVHLTVPVRTKDPA